METWKEIDWVFLGNYQVSNQGRVRRVDTGYFLKQWKTSAGYLRVDLYHQGQGQKFSVHRLVAQAFHGKPTEGVEVNHKNGNKADNRVENLEWVTRRENQLHSYKVLGRSVSHICQPGEGNGNAKLKRKDVIEIRQLLGCGEYTQTDIAELYGMSIPAINHISTGRRWASVND